MTKKGWFKNGVFIKSFTRRPQEGHHCHLFCIFQIFYTRLSTYRYVGTELTGAEPHNLQIYHTFSTLFFVIKPPSQ